MTKVVCISDTHMAHEKIDLPEGKILIHAGDMTFRGRDHELLSVSNWFRNISKRFKYIVFTPGNHDLMFESDEEKARSYFSDIPNVHCLINQEVVLDGLKFWGAPQTIRFFDWAFNVDADKMKDYWDKIPTDTDILITHSPPYGIGDITGQEERNRDPHLGCKDLRQKLEQIQPRLHVWGHIHGSSGLYRYGRTTCINAAIMNEDYQPVNSPIVIDL